MKNKLVIIVSLIFSAYIGYSDLHQTDTPITVAALLVAGFCLGLFVSKKAWLYGLLLGLGVPVANFVAASRHMLLSGMEHGQPKFWPATYNSAAMSLVAIVIATLGVYTGRGIRKLFQPTKVY